MIKMIKCLKQKKKIIMEKNFKLSTMNSVLNIYHPCQMGLTELFEIYHLQYAYVEQE